MKFTSIKTALATVVLAFAFTSYSSAQPEKRERQEPPSTEEIFKQMDVDEDGNLSKIEVKGPLKEGFDKIDTNKDGLISKEELEKEPKSDRKRSSKKRN